jgi:hypothetical protein
VHSLTETEAHRFLKDVAMAYLYNQNCFLVATEVHVGLSRERLNSELDAHSIIDVCGVGEKYISQYQRPNSLIVDSHDGSRTPYYKYNITRGIEVKVSKADFKNGLVCTGCNYNYLMVPEGLVWSLEVPKELGVIKVDIQRFRCRFHGGTELRFEFDGLHILRKPSFREIRQYQIDNVLASIAKRATIDLIKKVGEKLCAKGD